MLHRTSSLLLALPIIIAVAAHPGEAAAAKTASPPPTTTQAREAPTFKQVGVASWYGSYHQGRKTASGERFDMRRLSAAHRTLPLDTIARVTSVDTGKSVRVKINDRGPYAKGRVVDLSAGAARELGLTHAGVGKVKIEVFASDQRRSYAERTVGLP